MECTEIINIPRPSPVRENKCGNKCQNDAEEKTRSDHERVAPNWFFMGLPVREEILPVVLVACQKWHTCFNFVRFHAVS